MKTRPYLLIVSVLLALVAVGHILRVAFGLELIIEGYSVPMWVSWAAAIVSGVLAADGFRRVLKKN